MTIERASGGVARDRLWAKEIRPELVSGDGTACRSLYSQRQLRRNPADVRRMPDCILRKAGRLAELALGSNDGHCGLEEPTRMFWVEVAHVTRNNPLACCLATHNRFALVLA